MKTSVYILIVILFSSCWTYQDPQTGIPQSVSVIDLAQGAHIAITDPFPEGEQIEHDSKHNEKEERDLQKQKLKDVKSFKGWWIYGEGQHIFKDEESLDEYNLEFSHEDIEELSALYLAVCEMEYFPMECAMKGYIKKNISSTKNTLLVSEFEILYVEGCATT